MANELLLHIRGVACFKELNFGKNNAVHIDYALTEFIGIITNTSKCCTTANNYLLMQKTACSKNIRETLILE